MEATAQTELPASADWVVAAQDSSMAVCGSTPREAQDKMEVLVAVAEAGAQAGELKPGAVPNGIIVILVPEAEAAEAVPVRELLRALEPTVAVASES